MRGGKGTKARGGGASEGAGAARAAGAGAGPALRAAGSPWRADSEGGLGKASHVFPAGGPGGGKLDGGVLTPAVRRGRVALGPLARIGGRPRRRGSLTDLARAKQGRPPPRSRRGKRLTRLKVWGHRLEPVEGRFPGRTEGSQSGRGGFLDAETARSTPVPAPSCRSGDRKPSAILALYSPNSQNGSGRIDYLRMITYNY